MTQITDANRPYLVEAWQRLIAPGGRGLLENAQPDPIEHAAEAVKVGRAQLTMMGIDPDTVQVEHRNGRPPSLLADVCTLSLSMDEARFLHAHLANDERLAAQEIRDKIAREIARWEDIAAFRNPQAQHVARSW